MNEQTMTTDQCAMAFDIAAHELVIAGKPNAADALRTAVAALIAERDAFRKALQEIVKNDPHRMSSAGLIAREFLDAARAEAGHG